MTRRYWTLLLGIDHVDILQPLVEADGPVDDQQGRVRLADRQADRGRTSRATAAGRRPSASGSGRRRAPEMLPVAGLTWLLTKLMVPWCGKPSSPCSPMKTGNLARSWSGLILPSLIALRMPQQRGLVHVEVDVHRVQRDDGGQQRLVLVDQVAEGQVVAADLAVDGRR